MKQIKKYFDGIDLERSSSKLASYSAMAVAFLACSPDVGAQCGTATAGVPLGVDIDGDGDDDTLARFFNPLHTLRNRK